jgi:hypothetical protein
MNSRQRATNLRIAEHFTTNPMKICLQINRIFTFSTSESFSDDWVNAKTEQ